MAWNSLEKSVDSQILPNTGKIGKCLDHIFILFLPRGKHHFGIFWGGFHLLPSAPPDCWDGKSPRRGLCPLPLPPEREVTSTAYHPKEQRPVTVISQHLQQGPIQALLPRGLLTSASLVLWGYLQGGLCAWYGQICGCLLSRSPILGMHTPHKEGPSTLLCYPHYGIWFNSPPSPTQTFLNTSVLGTTGEVRTSSWRGTRMTLLRKEQFQPGKSHRRGSLRL